MRSNIGILGSGRLGISLAEYYHQYGNNILITSRQVNKKVIVNRNLLSTVDNSDAMKNSKILHLCVKPNNFNELAEQIKPYIEQDQIFISWLAKTKVKDISKTLEIDDKRVCRAMGNIFIRNKHGPVCLYKGRSNLNWDFNFPEVNKIWIKDENIMDTCTISAGCNPAYLAQIIDIFVKAGVESGLSITESTLIINENLKGLSDWLNKGLSTSSIKELVSSPNGVTERGLQHLVGSDLEKIIKDLYT